MIKTAGRAVGLTGVARTAEHLIAGRESVRDQPAIENPTTTGMTKQLNPMCATPAIHVIDRQATGHPAASARCAVVSKYLVTGLPAPAALRYKSLLRIGLLPTSLLLVGPLRILLLPAPRLFLDFLLVCYVVAATSCANFLSISLRPAALALSICHTRIIREAEFDDTPRHAARKHLRM